MRKTGTSRGVHLPSDLDAAITKISAARGWSKSHTIRWFISESADVKKEIRRAQRQGGKRNGD